MEKSQKAVTAYFSSKKSLPFSFARWISTMQRQKVVSSHSKNLQLLSFDFTCDM